MSTLFFSRKSWFIIPLGILLCFAGYIFYQTNKPGHIVLSMSSSGQSIDLSATEKQNPEEYVTGQIKMRRNFIDEVIVEGELRNIAKLISYKDVVLRVDFLSKAGTVLFTKDYTVCETLIPNGFAKYKFKNPPSQEVDRISGKILNAAVCE